MPQYTDRGAGRAPFTITEATRRLGVSPAWVRTLLHGGVLSGEKTSLGWFLDAASVEAEAARRAARQRERTADMPPWEA
jgi:hypothetical protein